MTQEHGSVSNEGGLTRRTVISGFGGAILLGGAGLARTGSATANGVATSESLVSQLRPDRPRLLASAGRLAAVRAQVVSDPLSARWTDKLRQDAERMLVAPPSSYELRNGNLLTISRRVRNRVLLLTFLHQLDGDARFAERVWTELDAAAGFPDWYPSHFLSTAEMTHAFAVGYDWLFDYWSPERRQLIAEAMVRLGLMPALNGYRSNTHWVEATSNWNIVCNGGIGTGALAIADAYPELAEEILQSGLESIPKAIAEYAPDGGYPEGVGSYWGYATRYLVAYLTSLQVALGDDQGLSDSPGLSETGYFPIYLAGPTRLSFNYYDGAPGSVHPPEMFWLARTYDRPLYTWWSRLSEASISSRHVLWYDPSTDTELREVGLPLDRYFRHSEVVTSRSAWEDPRAVFAGFKAGDNQTNHSDLDLGTFVLDALGERWAVELGSDRYTLPGYFDRGGQRWTYYRKRAEGQNTLVVAPDVGPDQDPLATGRIVRRGFGPTKTMAIADLSAAYADRGVESWQRGIALLNHRRQVLVQDELKATRALPAWWFMHTDAEVAISDDGRTAELHKGGVRLLAQILAPADQVVFEGLAAAPLPSSPDPEGQSDNAGIQKLAIRIGEATKLRLSVLFTPLRPWQEAADEPPTVLPLSSWNVPAGWTPELSTITVNGNPLEAFSSGVFTYDLDDVAVPDGAPAPVVDAGAGRADLTVQVNQAVAVPGTAAVYVRSGNGPATRYEIHFHSAAAEAFDESWDFRNQDPAQIVLGEREGQPAVLGTSEAVEPTDPQWMPSPTPDSSGTVPTVVSLDGVDDLVTLAGTGDVDLSSGFTFETWVHQRSRTTLPRLMSKGLVALWVNDDGSLHLIARDTGGTRRDVVTAAGALPLNTWTHVGLRYETDESGQRRFRIYVNGAETAYTAEGSFSQAARLDTLGQDVLLGNVEAHTRGVDGLLAYARLTVPGEPRPTWRDDLFAKATTASLTS